MNNLNKVRDTATLMNFAVANFIQISCLANYIIYWSLNKNIIKIQTKNQTQCAFIYKLSVKHHNNKINKLMGGIKKAQEFVCLLGV